MIVVLPWPSAVLSPNDRSSWPLKARAKAAARKTAWGLALEVRQPLQAPLSVSYTFHPPDNRRRDLDNMLGMMKSASDGIADAIGVDDRHWRPTLEWGPVVKGGEVVVRLQPLVVNVPLIGTIG